MQEEDFLRVVSALSPERLSGYGLRLEPPEIVAGRYWWNLALCEALYPPLHLLEIVFRNHIHQMFEAEFGTPNWFEQSNVNLRSAEIERIEEAKRFLRSKRKEPTPPGLMGELTLGFWVSLLDDYYEAIWRRLLKRRAFPYLQANRTRTMLLRTMGPLNSLRNRVFHHEPIWFRPDLRARHEDCLSVISWVSPILGERARVLSRFESVLGEGEGPFTQQWSG